MSKSDVAFLASAVYISPHLDAPFGIGIGIVLALVMFLFMYTERRI